MLRQLSSLALGLSILLAGVATADEPGIEIHGHWTIDILSAQGELVAHHEFENALVNPGAISGMITNDQITGGMYVIVTNQNAGSSGSGPCNPDCVLSDPGTSISITPTSSNLMVTQTGSNFEIASLAGSFTVANTSTIDVVQSWMLICGITKTVAQCKAGADSEALFTSRVLSTAINVTAGQIVQVKVDLTVS